MISVDHYFSIAQNIENTKKIKYIFQNNILRSNIRNINFFLFVLFLLQLKPKFNFHLISNILIYKHFLKSQVSMSHAIMKYIYKGRQINK
jgi:hypothetical protein